MLCSREEGFRAGCEQEPTPNGSLGVIPSPHCRQRRGGRGEKRAPYQVHVLEAVQKFTVAVLQAMGFVDDDAAPLDLPQLRAIGEDHLKGGDQGVKLVCAWDQATLLERGHSP